MVAKGSVTGRRSDSMPIATVQMRRAELLSLDLPGALIAEIRDWPGTLEENQVRRHPGRATQVMPAIDELILAGLVQAAPVWRTSRNWFVGKPDNPPGGQTIVSQTRMLYGADEAATYLRHRDGTAVNGFRVRHNSAMSQDHRKKKPHRSHTGQLDDVVTDLLLHGFALRSGHRDRTQYKGLPQLAPDAVMTAKVAAGTVEVIYIDSLLEGGVRLDVQDKLAIHLNNAARGGERMIILECRTRHGAEIAREEGARLVRERGLALPVLGLVSPVPSLTFAVRALANDFPGRFVTVEFYVEYERSARFPTRIRNKLRKYIAYAQSGSKFPVCLITETDQAEQFVLGGVVKVRV